MQSILKFHQVADKSIVAELIDKSFVINETQDIVDLMGELWDHDCRLIIIGKDHFNKDFFDLRTGLAGDILQKFSNYKLKLVITGNISEYKSTNFQKFVRESNQGNLIRFLPDTETALSAT
jgi:hypothetical protein